MQLIVNTDSDIGIHKKMTSIEQDCLDQNFINKNLIENPINDYEGATNESKEDGHEKDNADLNCNEKASEETDNKLNDHNNKENGKELSTSFQNDEGNESSKILEENTVTENQITDVEKVTNHLEQSNVIDSKEDEKFHNEKLDENVNPEIQNVCESEENDRNNESVSKEIEEKSEKPDEVVDQILETNLITNENVFIKGTEDSMNVNTSKDNVVECNETLPYDNDMKSEKDLDVKTEYSLNKSNDSTTTSNKTDGTLEINNLNKISNENDDELSVDVTDSAMDTKNEINRDANVDIAMCTKDEKLLEEGDENLTAKSDSSSDNTVVKEESNLSDPILKEPKEDILAENLNSKDIKDTIEEEKEVDGDITDKNNDILLEEDSIVKKEISEEVTVNDTKDKNDTLIETDINKPLDKDNVTNMETAVQDNNEEANDSHKNTSELEKSINKVKVTEEKNKLSHISKLSNTLDILSDDEEELKESPKVESQDVNDKQCISIEDDDDIMLIDEETNGTDEKIEAAAKAESQINNKEKEEVIENNETPSVGKEEKDDEKPTNNTEMIETPIDDLNVAETVTIENQEESQKEDSPPSYKPLVPVNFLKTCKKNFAEMTRDELEEFCILKIVESVVDRSNLNEIKSQLKTMAQNIDEYKKKALMLTKQNRDLQVVLKSVQEEQRLKTDLPITPLKITRSVGMQVLMTDKIAARRKVGPNVPAQNNLNANNNLNRINKTQVNQSPKIQKPQTTNTNTQQIPVPRLVPATNNANSINTKPVAATSNLNTPGKSPVTSNLPNGVRNSPPVQKPEKRSHSKMQQNNSVTVDLTDDEPPAKVIQRNVNTPVRLVPSQNLLAPQRQPFGPNVNSPRKVYIPISGPPSVRPGQTFMLKAISPQGPRPRANLIPKPNQNLTRVGKFGVRHPAPLPECTKQYEPPNWKSLPPAPELKLSKVENGIVISWKIDGYKEENHEEIASYQLYAYQETTSLPSTTLWKKIGDVKALPLPMACTLTQFMAGYKYFFAVRAVDVRSRLGPFSLPGSILLLNKM